MTKKTKVKEPEFVVEEDEEVKQTPTRNKLRRKFTPEEREEREKHKADRKAAREAKAKAKKGKPKREPSAYALYVKSKYDSVRDLPVKERLGAIGKMWKAEKAKAEKK